MTYAEQVAAAKIERDRERAEFESAEARYQALLANAVKGGIDVSEFQGDIDWTKVKAEGWGFAFVRSSDGDYVDPRYTAARITTIRSAGIPFGPYHFARVASLANNQRDGKQEAAMAYYFAARHGWGKAGDLPLVYDFENASIEGATAAKSATHVMQFIRAYVGLAGHHPIIYTNSSTWHTVLPLLSSTDLMLVQQCPLWIAEWGVTAPASLAPWGANGWTFWQHSETGTVSGIVGNVDLNRFSASKTELDALRLS